MTVLKALSERETPQRIKRVSGHHIKLCKPISKPTRKTKGKKKKKRNSIKCLHHWLYQSQHTLLSFPKHSNVYNSKQPNIFSEATMSELGHRLSSSEDCSVMEEQAGHEVNRQIRM